MISLNLMTDNAANSGQLALGIYLRDDATFENFYFSEANKPLQFALDSQLNEGGEQIIYVHGRRGSGCSHLLQAACHLADLCGKSSLYLPMEELCAMTATEVLEGIEQLDLIALDNIEFISGNDDWQEGLFHLINRVRLGQCRLLIGANNAPRATGITLADLQSRLSWGLVFHVHMLTDSEQRQGLQMRAMQRGLIVEDDVAQYILSRSSRGLASLVPLLDKLDKASMAEQRRLSIPFVRQYLDV